VYVRRVPSWYFFHFVHTLACAFVSVCHRKCRTIYCRNNGPQSHVQQNLLFLGLRNPAMPNANERITRHRNTVPAYLVHTDVELAELLCRVQTKSTTVTDAQYTSIQLHKSSKQMYKISGYAMWFTAGGAIREPQNP